MNKNLFIIPILDDNHLIVHTLQAIDSITDGDILIIDDGTGLDLIPILENNPHCQYIRHEQQLGFGAVFMTGYAFARDMNFEIIIMLDIRNANFTSDIIPILENLNYGYDIITCSRILENVNHESLSEDYIRITSIISEALHEITDLDLTDPLSGIQAYRVASLEQMELTEFSHTLLLQLWVQAHYFDLTILEIPTQTNGESFGSELDQYDEPLDLFLATLESENYLYKKGNIQ